MNYFESELFRLSLVFLVFFIFYGFVLFLFRNQIKNHIAKQSDERKLKISQGLPKLIKFIKTLLWIMPAYLAIKTIFLFINPLATEINFFNLTLMTISYLGLLIVFYFFKMLLDVVGKESEKE